MWNPREPTLRTFNPFNPLHGSSVIWHNQLQEVILYGESRLRRATIAISKAEPKHQLWMQQCLYKELVRLSTIFLSLSHLITHVRRLL